MQEKLREQLINIIQLGLSAKSIAEHAGISYDILAKFKQGKLCLIPDDVQKLKGYLDNVVIPN
jgi:predicted transcriptional regulator